MDQCPVALHVLRMRWRPPTTVCWQHFFPSLSLVLALFCCNCALPAAQRPSLPAAAQLEQQLAAPPAPAAPPGPCHGVCIALGAMRLLRAALLLTLALVAVRPGVAGPLGAPGALRSCDQGGGAPTRPTGSPAPV